MSNESEIRDLFDRWERVWHEGQYDLIPSCVGPHYLRHDEQILFTRRAGRVFARNGFFCPSGKSLTGKTLRYAVRKRQEQTALLS
jgi:hypothetical protein